MQNIKYRNTIKGKKGKVFCSTFFSNIIIIIIVIIVIFFFCLFFFTSTKYSKNSLCIRQNTVAVCDAKKYTQNGKYTLTLTFTSKWSIKENERRRKRHTDAEATLQTTVVCINQWKKRNFCQKVTIFRYTPLARSHSRTRIHSGYKCTLILYKTTKSK